MTIQTHLSEAMVIAVHNTEFMLHVGVGEEERNVPQKILIDFTLFLPTLPKGAESDKIEETICYETLMKHIKNTAHLKPYRLLEHLSATLYSALKKELPEKMCLWLKVAKATPPASMSKGQVSVACGIYPPWFS